MLQAYDDLVTTANKADENQPLAELGRQVSIQFIKENFFEHKYKDLSGKRSREVLMTRNGSSVLVMGFKGKKALNFKIALMIRFNKMEAFIQSLQNAKLEHPALTEAIMNAHEDPRPYHYSNEADMINQIVLGMKAKQFRELNGIAKGQSIRPYLTTEQIQAVEMLQRVDIGLIEAGLEFPERREKLTRRFERMKLKLIA